MHIVYGVLGASFVIVVTVDVLWTTLWVDGSAGPVTRRLTTWAWAGVTRLGGTSSHRTLSMFGPSILVVTVGVWTVLLAAGWVLLLMASASSLTDTVLGKSIGVDDRIWFVAYTLSGVGNGDFAPTEGGWQIVSSLIAASGLFILTLSISYVLSVLSAVVAKRAFAGQVSGLGRSAEALVISGWNGHDLHALDSHMIGMSSQLSRLTEQYLSYPILQYYHAASPDKSPVKAAAILDDAVTLMSVGVADSARPHAASLTSVRSAIADFVDNTQRAAAIAPAKDTPPRPCLDTLRHRGIPTVDDASFRRDTEDLDDHRRSLLGLVRGDGWEWST